ncbi:MAG: putative toxin-antitoxin system toxin component, PIN family [Alphaproteobacteria bacterium]
MRLVLDTNVLVAAMRSKAGASAQLVQAAYAGRIVALASVPLFAEYEAVLTRPEHGQAAGVSADVINAALDALAARIEPVEPHFSWRPQLSDPDDEMVLDAAVNGAAEAIVTFEVETFRAAAARFGVLVLTPAQAWARIRA